MRVKIFFDKEKLEKQEQEEEKQYIAKLNSNFENKTKLFGVQLIDNPKNYNVSRKNILKKILLEGFILKIQQMTII